MIVGAGRAQRFKRRAYPCQKRTAIYDRAEPLDSISVQRTVADLPYLYVNGGRRGYLVGMEPADLIRVLEPTLVDIAV